MKKFLKALIKNITISLSSSYLVYLSIMIFLDMQKQGKLVFTNYQHTKDLIGILIIGISFGCAALIYDFTSLSLPLQTLTHALFGTLSVLGVGTYLGWFPLSKILFVLLFIIIIYGIIWLGFYLYYRHLADSLNKKLH